MSRGLAARIPAVAGMLFALLAARAAAQTAGAQLQREQKPQYPEGLSKAGRQGNVLLIGRVDRQGKVQDIQPVATTNIGFLDPAVAAVKAWQFRPAVRNGKPVDVAVNVGIRYRLDGAKRGELPRPALGDLSVFPADATGKKSAPEGFPIHRGTDPRLRVEAVVDATASDKAQHLPVHAEALSPSGRRIALWDGTVNVPPKTAQVPVQFASPVGGDWEDGVWRVNFAVAGTPAGGGAFWLAGDPERYDFAADMAKGAVAAAASAANPGIQPAPAAPAKPAAAKPAPAAPPRKK
jgi:TonB family protein